MVEVCQSPSQSASGALRDPHWTSALFLPHEHAAVLPSSCTGAGKTALGRSMSVEAVTLTNEDAARRRIGADRGACRPRCAAGADLARHRAGAAVAACGGGSAVRRRQRRVAGDRARNPPAAHALGAGDRRHSRAVRRVAAGPAAQSAGLALAVRRAAIGRLRRGAGDRAGAGRCALLCAAGGGDHRGVRFRVRAALDRRPQCRAFDPHSRRALRFRALRAPPPRW